MEIEVKSLYYTEVEIAICNTYNLGYTNSSSFTELSLDKSTSAVIYATKGNIKCCLTAYQKKGSEKFIVEISGAEVKLKK